MIEVVWFKRDLRTVDHRPLAEAACRGEVLPLYIVEPDYWRLPDTSVRQWEAVAAAITELQSRLSNLGAPLIIRVGSAVDVIARIHSAVGIARLWAHEETGNDWTFRRDRQVRAFCAYSGVEFIEYSQTGVVRGPSVDRDQWAARHRHFLNASIVTEPQILKPVTAARVLPLPTAAQVGFSELTRVPIGSATRKAAGEQLESFLEGRGAGYRRGMSSPETAAAVCSRLSVALMTGAVSAREVVQRLQSARRSEEASPPDRRNLSLREIDSLMRRLYWRGHFIQKLETEPSIEFRAFHAAHEAHRTPTDADHPSLEAWVAGRTGFPFLDACMRSLTATGWLNFRMRAMVQSFASYHLGLDWRVSGQRLARLFTDYEPGIHWSQVQMQSGQTGINVPRIYNPVKQGLEQDPNGTFTRRWVPELAAVSDGYLQMPWLAGTASLDYPDRIVDHEEAARLAKERLPAIRSTSRYRETAQDVFVRHGSRLRRSDAVEASIKSRNRRQKDPESAPQLSLL